MADKSSIEWTEATWNPTTGCDRVSRGCDNCYALTLAKRLKAMGAAKYQNDGDPRTSGQGFAITIHPDALGLPYTWRQPRIVFVNSMSDLLHARVPIAFVRDVFDVMRGTPQHTCQLLTKQPRDPTWVRGIRDACETAGVAFFHKQWGGRTPKAGGRDLDGRTWDEIPQLAAAHS
jgi:protein gp37